MLLSMVSMLVSIVFISSWATSPMISEVYSVAEPQGVLERTLIVVTALIHREGMFFFFIDQRGSCFLYAPSMLVVFCCAPSDERDHRLRRGRGACEDRSVRDLRHRAHVVRLPLGELFVLIFGSPRESATCNRSSKRIGGETADDMLRTRFPFIAGIGITQGGSLGMA